MTINLISKDKNDSEIVDKSDSLSKINDSEPEQIGTVNTDDCIMDSKLINEKNLKLNKYIINPNFNEQSPEKNISEDLNIEGNENSSFQNWIPSVLKDESWPDELGSNSNNDKENNIESSNDFTDNPLLSKATTMLQKPDLKSKEMAEWRKYRDEQFFRNFNNDNLKLIPNNDFTIPDTFANKPKFKNINSESFTPSSPLKLFGNNHDTYTKDKFKNLLNQITPDDLANEGKKGSKSDISEVDEPEKINQMLKASEQLFQKIVTGSSAGSETQAQKLKQTDNLISQDTSNTSVTDSEEFTSDAEEFNSIKSLNSTTKDFYNDGSKLYDNLKKKLNSKIPVKSLSENNSDYTSNEDDGIDEEYEFKSEIFDENSTRPTTVPPLTSSSNVEVNNLLSSMRQKLGIEAIDIDNINGSVPKPKLKSNLLDIISDKNIARKAKGLNFISADEYKDKVFDKKQGKYILISEYDELYKNGKQEFGDQGENDISFENASILKSTNNNIKKKKSNNNHNNNISFNLPDETSSDSETKSFQNSTKDQLSFSQTNSALVSAIAESYPEKDWRSVKELDISRSNLDKLRDLKILTPNLWLLDASNNKINHSFGIPNCVQVLNLNNNKFSIISTSFFDFNNLQILDLSNNKLENFSCLKKLVNLTSLNLKSNNIKSLDYLENFHMLRYLNLSGNKLEGELNFEHFQLWFLEDLILNDNNFTKIKNIINLPKLIFFSIKRNNIKSISLDSNDLKISHLSLKKILISNNKLTNNISFSNLPNLKEIEIDKNFLFNIEGISKNIEKISFKYNDNSNSINDLLLFSVHYVNFKTLNISGGKLPSLSAFQKSGKFSNITILDVSAMNIEKLPLNFSLFFPLLTDLNLNFNKLKTLKGLENLNFLKQLKLLGNNIGEIKEIVEFTSQIRESLKLIDLRVNPITKKIYPFVFYDETSDYNNEVKSHDNSNGWIDEEEEIDDDDSAGNDTLKLQDYEDIEAFSVEYTRLYESKSLKNWYDKDLNFKKRLNKKLSKLRDTYLMEMLVWFKKIKYLDGLRINHEQRRTMRRKFWDLSNN